MKRNKVVEAAVAAIELAGFEKKIEIEKSWDKKPEHDYRKVTLTNEAEKIRFEMEFFPTDSKSSMRRWDGAYSVNGHTHFVIEGRGWVTFDRIGVDDSFHGGENRKNHAALDVVLACQLKKIAASRERARSTQALPAPLSAWHRTPEEIEQLKEQLKKTGCASFQPAGFGIGYFISLNARHTYAKPAPQLAKFLGFAKLYAEQTDCD